MKRHLMLDKINQLTEAIRLEVQSLKNKFKSFGELPKWGIDDYIYVQARKQHYNTNKTGGWLIDEDNQILNESMFDRVQITEVCFRSQHGDKPKIIYLVSRYYEFKKEFTEKDAWGTLEEAIKANQENFDKELNKWQEEQQKKADEKLAVLMKTKEFVQEGYAGVNQNGTLTDRRVNPDVTPCQENPAFNTPEPKPISITNHDLEEETWEVVYMDGKKETVDLKTDSTIENVYRAKKIA